MACVITRRKLIAGIATGGASIALSACTGPTYNTFFEENVLSIGDWLNYRVQRLIMGTALAREFPESEMSPVFRTNGNTDPGTPEYQKSAANQFADWRLRIDGLVGSPTSYSLAQLRAMPWRTQITRWSDVGDRLFECGERICRSDGNMQRAGRDHGRCFPENSGDFGAVLRATLVKAMESNVLVHERPKIARCSIVGHISISDEVTVL